MSGCILALIIGTTLVLVSRTAFFVNVYLQTFISRLYHSAMNVESESMKGSLEFGNKD